MAESSGLPSRAAYHASKHGAIGLTRSAAVEYASRGVRINAVCPGTIDTPMVSDMLATQADAMKDILRDQPIGGLGRSEEIAAAMLRLQAENDIPQHVDCVLSKPPKLHELRAALADLTGGRTSLSGAARVKLSLGRMSD